MAGLSRSHALFRTERQNREDAHLEEKRERLDIREAKDRERSRLRHHEVDTAYSVAPSPREPVFPGSGAVPAHSNPGEPTNRHSPRAGAALLSPGNGEAAQRPPSRSQSAAFSPPKSRPTTRSNSPMVGARRGNNSRTPTPVINTADVHSPSNPRSGSHSPPGLRRHARDRDSVGSPDSAGGSGRKPARAQVPPPQQPQVLLPQQQQQQQQRRPPSAFAGPNHLHQQQQQTAGGRKHSQGYHRPVPHYATPLQRVQDVELLLAEHERNQLNRSDTYVHPEERTRRFETATNASSGYQQQLAGQSRLHLDGHPLKERTNNGSSRSVSPANGTKTGDRKDAQITELQDQLLNALRRLSESDLERQNLEQRIVEFERRETERSFAALDADERQAVGLLRAMETEQARHDAITAMQQVGNGQQLAAVETQVRRDLDTTLKRYEAQLAAVAEEASAERAAIEQQASERVQQALRDRDAVAEEYASFRAQVVATESELRLREAALQIVIGKMEARLGEAELRYIIAEERAEEAEIRVLEYQEQQEQQEEDQQQQQQQQQEQKQQQQQQQEPQREQQRQQQPERSRSRSRSRSVGSSLDVRAAEACRVERGPRASGASADRRGEGADPPSEQQPSSWSASAAHASQSCAWGSFLLAITLCCAFVVIELATSAEVVSPILPYCQEAATNVRYAWNHRLWPVNVEVALLATLLLFLGGVPIGRSVRQTSVALLLLAVAFALTTLLIDSTTEASITPSIIASCKKRLPELREDLQIYADRRVAALVSCRESAERALAASWDLLAVSVEAAGKVAGDCLRQLRGAADRVVACFSSSPAGLSDDEAPAVVDEYCEE